jgi:ribose transport system substrate-binding protein
MVGRVRRVSATAAAIVLAVGVAACGSSSKGGSGSSTSAGGGATSTAQSTSSSSVASGVATAQAAVKAASKAPTKIGPTVPVGKPIPTGKTIVFVNSGAAINSLFSDALVQAGKLLGWTVKSIYAQPTPQGLQNAFQQAVQLDPDGVATSGVSVYEAPHQIAELNAKKIPIVDTATTNTSSYDPSKGITLSLFTPAQVGPAFKLLADATVADDGGHGTIASILIGGFPISLLQTEAYEGQVKALCPKCVIKRLEINATEIGTDAATKIAEFLRANPAIKQMFFSYDGFGAGLQTALKNAGVTAPKIYTWAPEGGGMGRVRSGFSTVAVPYAPAETGWQMADAFARIFAGANVKDSQPWQKFVLWSKSEFNNVPASPENPPVVGSYESQFKKLWGK